jgi:hypothetical protein
MADDRSLLIVNEDGGREATMLAVILEIGNGERGIEISRVVTLRED